MMAIVLANALLVDIDPPRVEAGELRIAGGKIAGRGGSVPREANDEVVDCGGAVVLPGLVNGHAHLYSALAAGMPMPPKSPTNFVEILEYIWWRLDRALDPESITASGRVGALDALRCGTTALIDHHASPECIDGSLDMLEHGIADVGLRGVLCYEVTDRNGINGRKAGISESERYVKRCRSQPNGFVAGMIGGHASFTLDDETLDALSELAKTYDTGVHIHVAEDPADEADCRTKHDVSLIDRLAEHGTLMPKSIFAHCTHLDAAAIGKVNEAGLSVAHNPRSNMNNGVGYTPIGKYSCPVVLGTDGIGSDMFTEAKHAWFESCDEHAGISPATVMGMLATSARRASESLGVTLGKLEAGAAADIVLTSYRPATPLTTENLPGHFIYAMGCQHVSDVMVDGRWALRDGTVQTCDEPKVRVESIAVAKKLWGRMAAL